MQMKQSVWVIQTNWNMSITLSLHLLATVISYHSASLRQVGLSDLIVYSIHLGILLCSYNTCRSTGHESDVGDDSTVIMPQGNPAGPAQKKNSGMKFRFVFLCSFNAYKRFGNINVK